MNKELILTYIYGNDYRFKGLPCDPKGNYLFDGNLMIAAKDKMVEKGDWSDFDYYVFYNKYSGADYNAYTAWLFQPDRFFELMSEALEKGVIGK